MTDELLYDGQHDDVDWGASFSKIKAGSMTKDISICHVRISDLKKIAGELSKRVLDRSWIMDLDPGSRSTYQTTVAETASVLADVFQNKMHTGDKVSSEFGEVMVSMGSARALEVLFAHISMPIAELWKPKVLGNEGFDFHTICPNKHFNFGEAKFSAGSSNPYGGESGKSSGAGGQADGFIKADKHKRDRPYLINLEIDEAAVSNLDNDEYGVILAFSMNAKKPLEVFKNAIDAALSYQNLKKAKKIYVVGVSHAA